MNENNSNPISDIINDPHPEIKCIIHKFSKFVDGNINNISIYQELCYIYNTIFKLQMTFSESYNNFDSNVLVENLPTIVYANQIVRKPNIKNFLNQLLGLKSPGELVKGETDIPVLSKLNSEDLVIKSIEIENLEKILFSEFQLAINYYKYIDTYDKTNSLVKIWKYIYQPWRRVKVSRNDSGLLQQITKILGISSKYEAIEFIKSINAKIENLLSSFGEAYSTGIEISKRQINSLDLMLYAAFKTENRVLFDKIQSYELDKFPNFMKLVNSIDHLILNDKFSQIGIKILSPNEIQLPKIIFATKTFGKYLELPKEEEGDIKKSYIRRGVFSGLFIGLLLLLKFAYK
jgi:hypothetical protein